MSFQISKVSVHDSSASTVAFVIVPPNGALHNFFAVGGIDDPPRVISMVVLLTLLRPVGMSAKTTARKEGAAAPPDVGPAKTKFAATVDAPVPPLAIAIVVPFHTPVVIVPTDTKDDSVVTAELTSVPEVGSVTFVVPVVVSVKEFAPLVMRLDPAAMVSVAEVPGFVITTLLIEEAMATPRLGVISVGVLARTTAPDPVTPSLRSAAAGLRKAGAPAVVVANNACVVVVEVPPTHTVPVTAGMVVTTSFRLST